jgi:hypothetical protein
MSGRRRHALLPVRQRVQTASCVRAMMQAQTDRSLDQLSQQTIRGRIVAANDHVKPGLTPRTRFGLGQNRPASDTTWDTSRLVDHWPR